MTYFRTIFTPFAILLTQILESLKNYLTLAYSLVTTNSSEETNKLLTRNTNTFDVKTTQ